MIIKTTKSIPSSEITDPLVFKQRRQLIKAMVAMGLTGSGLYSDVLKASEDKAVLTPTAAEIVKNHTNYYEFTFNKTDATKLAQVLPTDPWSVEITGEVEHPGIYHLEDLLSQQSIQEYIYRFRCVEAWSMVVPWMGFPLANL